MTPEATEIARNSLLLSSAPEPLVSRILAHAHLTHHARGETIFLQGDAADTIFIVSGGWVKLYRIASNGIEAVVGTFTKGQSFGEAVALRPDTYPVSAEAVTACSVVRVDAGAFLHDLESNPKIAIAMLTATYAHLHSLVAQVEQLKSRTGPQRVAEFLLDLSECTRGSCTVKLPYDKVLIAGRLGMKPESLSRAFAKLKDCGVAIRQNAAEIADVERLRAFSENDPATAWTR